MDRATVVVGFAVVTLLISWFIGVYFTRAHKSLLSYYAAEKGLPTFVIMMATGATIMSGWTFVGGPGIGYAYGYAYWTPLFVILPGLFLNWGLCARKFRIMGDTHGVMTVNDIVLERYKSRFVSGMTSLACFAGYIAYLSAQVKSLGWVMNVIFGWSFEVSTVVGLVILTSYTTLGGVHAAVFADVFQGVLMILASVFIAIAAFWIVGGIGPTYDAMKTINPRLAFPAIGTWTPLYAISYAVAGIGFNQWPHITARYIMIRNLTGFRWTPFAVTWITFAMGLIVYGVPYAYLTLQARGDPGAPVLKVADTVTPTFLMAYMPGSVSGIVFAGVLAAILSTASGFVNSGSAVFVRDLWQRAFRLPLRNEVMWARIASLSVVVVAWGLGLTAGEFVVIMGMIASGIWASTILLVVNVGLNWRGASKQGALATMLWGLPSTLILQLGNTYKWWRLPAGALANVFTFPISVVLFVVVSKLTNPRREVPADMELIMRMPFINRQPSAPLVRRAAPAGGSGEEQQD